MTYQTLEQLNATGAVGFLQVASNAVPILPGLILAGMFVIIAFASYYATQRRFGKGDLPASFAVSGFVVVIIAFLMSLIDNFITNETIVPVVILEILFVLWLMMDSRG